jgi:cellulose synthase/poly-beta-1,6-N-acetylglucosamine synthase-like glycosyltransferase
MGECDRSRVPRVGFSSREWRQFPVSLAASAVFPDVSVDRSVSIIVPTFNGALRIGKCLDALVEQCAGRHAEILVINDGSTDGTAEVVKAYCGPQLVHRRRQDERPVSPRRVKVRLINQPNAGPAAARNRGVKEAWNKIIVFIDDDCVPAAGWLDAMIAPFDDPKVVGAKGSYKTRQTKLAARFVQMEYEERYRRMARFEDIDFIDTYSAAFRRDRLLEVGGFDTSFPVACAEDVDLSYRMAARGWKMKFARGGIVYHTHPDTIRAYLKKKYKFAFWRVLAVWKNPRKGLRDSHTPQLMKLQLLFVPALLCAFVIDVVARPRVLLSALVLAAFIASTLPFAIAGIKKDRWLGALSPLLLAARSCAQGLGVIGGFLYAWQRSKPATKEATLNHDKSVPWPEPKSRPGSVYE